jgi:hypothetical protein
MSGHRSSASEVFSIYKRKLTWSGGALALTAVLALLVLAALGPERFASASGQNSPPECLNPDDQADNPFGEDPEPGDTTTLNAPAGLTFLGICIKSATPHSDLVEDDAVLGAPWAADCFVIDFSADRTSVTITLAATYTGPVCGGLSHIDIFYEAAAPTLLIRKVCIPDVEGVTFSFALDPNGDPVGPHEVDCGELSDPIELDNDQLYTLTETTSPEDWTLTDFTCDIDFAEVENGVQFTTPLEGGGLITCTATNTFEPELPQLTINKVCEDPTGETLFTFDLVPNNGIPMGPYEAGCGGSAVTFLQFSTEYTLTEDVSLLPEGWTFNGPITCVSDAVPAIVFTPTEAGGVEFTTPVQPSTPVDISITCTAENTFEEEEAPTLVIDKECVNSQDASFEFTLSPDGDPAGPHTVACGDESDPITLEPGVEYTLTENSLPDGWTLDEIECSVETTASDSGVTFTAPVDPVTIVCTATNIFACPAVCPCPCPGQDLNIKISNTNTNVIGIENENENENTNTNENNNTNNNTNTNTQNQTNDQNQDNTNEQTNNIDSSPKVNIDFGKK